MISFLKRVKVKDNNSNNTPKAIKSDIINNTLDSKNTDLLSLGVGFGDLTPHSSVMLVLTLILCFILNVNNSNTVLAKGNKHSCLIKRKNGKIEYNVEKGKGCSFIYPLGLTTKNILTGKGKNSLDVVGDNSGDDNNGSGNNSGNSDNDNDNNSGNDDNNNDSSIVGCKGLPKDIIANSSINYNDINGNFIDNNNNKVTPNENNISQLTASENSVIRVICNDGYRADGTTEYICKNKQWVKNGGCVAFDNTCGNYEGRTITAKGSTSTYTNDGTVNANCCNPSANKYVSVDKRLMYVIGTDRYYSEGWDKKTKEEKVMEVVNAISNSNIDLQCLDLSHTNFKGKDFSNKNIFFAYSNGVKSNLSGANFSNITGSGYVYFGLKGNSGSDLTNADFSNAVFNSKVYFGNYDNSGSNLTNADFSGVRFSDWVYFGYNGNSGSNLTGANFSGVSFGKYVYFGHSDNSGSNLTNADFSNAVFNNNIYINKTNFCSANFNGSNITYLKNSSSSYGYGTTGGFCPDGTSSNGNKCDGHMTSISTSECPAWTAPNDVAK